MNRIIRRSALLTVFFTMVGIWSIAAQDAPRSLKEGARIRLLALLEIGDVEGKTRATVENAVKEIEKSLADEGLAQFIDDFRILPPPEGRRVFKHEHTAVDHLVRGIDGKKTEPSVADVFQEVVGLLVEADQRIASQSIVVGEDLVELGLADPDQLAQARQRFEDAAQATDPAAAIDGFENAWELTQTLIPKVKQLFITKFDDQPDPFSPSLTASSFSVTFNLRMDVDDTDEDEAAELDEENVRRFLDLNVIIRDPENNVVRNLSSRREIFLPAISEEALDDTDFPEFIQVPSELSWDGKDTNGETVADGAYSYLAFGEMIQAKDDGSGEIGAGGPVADVEKEKVKAMSFPVFGTVLLDNTPPILVATLDPEPNSAGWNNSAVIVSFEATDVTSGVASVSDPVTLSAEGANQIVDGTAIDHAGNTATASVTVNIDETAPVVQILSPSPGFTVIEGTSFPVTVDASDNVGVESVNVLVDGQKVGTDSTAPYLFNVSAPVGVNQIVLTARATDPAGNVGESEQLPVDVTVNPPPTITIVEPQEGDTAIEESTILVSADANDNGSVQSVIFAAFVIDGGQVLVPAVFDQIVFAPPYEVALQVPVGIDALQIDATAIDDHGAESFDTITLNVIPDPLTSVIGSVVDPDGVPVSGAAVSLFGVTGQTGVDGAFQFDQIPTILGDISVAAEATLNGERFFGRSASLPPVLGGVTDVGVITLAQARFEELGRFNPLSDDSSVLVPLPSGFPFYGQNYNSVYVNNNGNLTFGSGDSDYTETVFEFVANPPRIAPLWDDLINDRGNSNSGVYINDQLPDRVGITWFEMLQYFQIPGPNTVQAVLFSDGKIKFGYRGGAALDSIVGLSPGGNASATQVDFSASPSFTANPGEAVFEQFTGLSDPFDLDGSFVLFDPNGTGGYDVTVTASSFSNGLLNHGLVIGSVTDSSGVPVSQADVEIRTSGLPSYRALTTTDAEGFYGFETVPCGGGIITVTASLLDIEIGRGVGILTLEDAGIVIDVTPIPSGPVKKDE